MGVVINIVAHNQRVFMNGDAVDIGNPIIVETGTFPFRVDVSGHLPGEGHDARWPIRRLGNHEGIAVHRDFIGLPEGV